MLRRLNLTGGGPQVVLPYVLMVVMIAISLIIQPLFLSASNISQTLQTSLPLILVCIAGTIVILTGGIDLSVGSLMSLVNVICATLPHTNYGLSLIVGEAVGVASGLLIGVLVAYFGLQPIVVTLAAGIIYTGIALYILPNPGGSMEEAVHFLDSPTGISLLLVLLIAGWGLFLKTTYKQQLYAVGTNEQAAYMSGIETQKVKVITYAISGGITALAGLVLSGLTGSGDPHIADSYTLTSIAAIVLGGTSLLGGAGGAYGSMVGAVVLYLITNIIFFLGVSSFYQGIVQGLILIIALSVGFLFSYSKRRKRRAAGGDSAT